MRLPLVALKGRPVTVNLVDDALHWRLRHHVEDIYERVRLRGADAFRGLFGKPVEFRCPTVKQREYGKAAVRTRRTRWGLIRQPDSVCRDEFGDGQTGRLR